MERKAVPVQIKAAGEAGSFTALAAVFGNTDRVGDRMMPGAFSKTLEKWRESGDPIPVILSHKHDDPMAMIGRASPDDVVETNEGLVVQGQLDVKDNPTARQVHKLLKDRMLKGWSFAYQIPEGGQKRAKDGANEVSEVELIETGPTLVGANPEAQLQAVKALAEAAEPGTELTQEADSSATSAEDRGPKAEDPQGKAERQDPPRKTSQWTETEKWFLEVFGP